MGGRGAPSFPGGTQFGERLGLQHFFQQRKDRTLFELHVHAREVDGRVTMGRSPSDDLEVFFVSRCLGGFLV